MREKQQTEKLSKNPNRDHRKKTTDTRSASCLRWVTRLAGLLLISGALSGSQALAQDIEKSSSTITCGDGHYAYKYEKNISDRCRDCADPKNKYVEYKEHGKKKYHNKACSLWNSVKTSCIDGHHKKWHPPHGCYNKGYQNIGNPPVVIEKGTDCHFMAIPTVPVIGVEDKVNRDKFPYWFYAWAAVTLPAPYPEEINTFYKFWEKKKKLKRRIGLAVNPVEHRTQHQLHIHIGKIPPDIRKYLLEKHVPHDKQWHKLTIKNKDCRAKFVPGKTVPSPFREVSKYSGENKMKDLGIILAGHVNSKDELEGFIILSCDNACVECWLDYTCPQN
jgi:CDP-diacylglycerol pyrophosphatase